MRGFLFNLTDAIKVNRNKKYLFRFFNSSNKGDTVNENLQFWLRKFQHSGLPEPQESIEHILAYVLGTKKVSDVYKSRKRILTTTEKDNLAQLCRKRFERLPVQYIIQEWDFRHLTLEMRPPVFIPRPETEMLVDLVLQEIDYESDEQILELCCGTGAISLALLHERHKLKAYALDQSEEACILTMGNAKKYGLSKRISVFKSKLTETNNLPFLKSKFNIIVSNPPYVFSKDMLALAPEILRYEDLQALDGGADGLSIIKLILTLSSHLLNDGGSLFLEVDPLHPKMLQSLLLEDQYLSLKLIQTYKDFCDKERFVKIIKVKG